MKKVAGILILFIVITITFSCRKDDVTTDSSAKLSFSNDSVLFDTVFATIGSTTKRLLIYNRNDDKIIISSISLAKGNGSQFRINVDGVAGNNQRDIEIEGNDSLFIFVEVTVDPNNTLTPFVVEESLNFVTNGNNQSVLLVAWGQNAHYFVANQTVSGVPVVYLDRDNSDNALDSTWINDKPYVIYGGYLTLDDNDKLTIDPGVRVHLSNSGGIWVFKDANIQVNGTLNEPVIFQGLRLDQAFQDVSGQWDRIWINEGSINNVFNHAVIKNAFIGIQAETLPFDPNAPTSSNQLILNACVISNCSALGILATNYKIQTTNTLISNCGQYNLLVRGGGEYQFDHTTFANYWSESSRQTPAVLLQNYYIDANGSEQFRRIESADFRNCIIDGNVDIEFETDFLDTNGGIGALNFRLDHAILKTTNVISGPNYVNVIQSPSDEIFTDRRINDFSLIDNSPAIGNGSPIGITEDIIGTTRDFNNPDLGAFEF